MVHLPLPRLPRDSWQLTVPGTTQSTDKLADWSIAYRTLSLSLSVLLTTAIVGRILHMRRLFSKCGFRADDHYLSAVTVLVESASLETTTAFIYIICVGVNSPLQTMFLPVLAQVQPEPPVAHIRAQLQGGPAVAAEPDRGDEVLRGILDARYPTQLPDSIHAVSVQLPHRVAAVLMGVTHAQRPRVAAVLIGTRDTELVVRTVTRPSCAAVPQLAQPAVVRDVRRRVVVSVLAVQSRVRARGAASGRF
ncbi:hypothetical protein EWM64_g1114 [Hericium alpestre]|uniref:Uncharacterized protein n=1 Tax=Hericium alpestre TaxID=135208 RepID=A0A4Z0AAC4_9AGAM|nr:hypothetical protein EWM64_g1114 [Hericium alpestre]